MNTEQILTTLKQSGKLDVIKSIIDEALTEEKKDWNRRCDYGKYYWYLYINTWRDIRETNVEWDDRNYNLAIYFPCSEYTQETLIADGVHRMGLTERWAYKFAKGNGYPWLTEEERLDYKKCGYVIIYDCNCCSFRVFTYWACAKDKWFANKEHAQLFCDWANIHLKPNGELK